MHWAAYFLVMGAARAKRRLLARGGEVASEPAAASAREAAAEPKKAR